MRIQRAFLLVLAAASQAAAYFPDLRQILRPEGSFDCLNMNSGVALGCVGRSSFFDCSSVRIPADCAVLENPDSFARISAAHKAAGIDFRLKENCATQLMCKPR